jgi:hypothetical protein
MPTFNFVPRADHEGNIGALNRRWTGGYFDLISATDFSDGVRTFPMLDIITALELLATISLLSGLVVCDGDGTFTTPDFISLDPISKLILLGTPDHPAEVSIFADQADSHEAALWVHQKGAGIGIHITCADDTVCSLGIESADLSRTPVHLTGSGCARFAQGGGYVTIRCNNDTSPLSVGELQAFPNNAAAVLAGLTPGAFYRTGGDPDLVCVVH